MNQYSIDSIKQTATRGIDGWLVDDKVLSPLVDNVAEATHYYVRTVSEKSCSFVNDKVLSPLVDNVAEATHYYVRTVRPPL